MNSGASPACPAVTLIARGRACVSLAPWTFVLRQSRERPRAWPVGSPGTAFPLQAPAACWWALQTLESTEALQPMSSSASAAARMAAKIFSQAPSIARRNSHLCAVLKEPSSTGRSRQGEQARYFHARASIVRR